MAETPPALSERAMTCERCSYEYTATKPCGCARPDRPPLKTKVQIQGEARLAVRAAMNELREALDVADLETEPPMRVQMQLNDLARAVTVTVRDFGRTL